MKGLSIFQSYNCFYSCLGTMLKSSYGWGLNTVLHTQWQFFYNKKWTYDQDNRFVGEFQSPCHDRVIEKFREVLNIQIIKHNDKVDNSLLIKIQRDIGQYGASLVIVNKFFYDRVQGKKIPFPLLTTVLITAVDHTNHRVKFIMGDDNLTQVGWINTESFFKSLKYAPHGRTENGSRFTFRLPPSDKGRKEIVSLLEKYAPCYLVQTAEAFITGSQSMNLYDGAIAMDILASDILTWPNSKVMFNEIEKSRSIFERLIDCAKFIMFVKQQRVFFIEVLLEIKLTSIGKYVPINDWIDSINKIINRWESLRYLFFLAGSRHQIGAVNKIALEIMALKDLEIQLQREILTGFKAIVSEN